MLGHSLTRARARSHRAAARRHAPNLPSRPPARVPSHVAAAPAPLRMRRRHKHTHTHTHTRARARAHTHTRAQMTREASPPIPTCARSLSQPHHPSMQRMNIPPPPFPPLASAHGSGRPTSMRALLPNPPRCPAAARGRRARCMRPRSTASCEAAGAARDGLRACTATPVLCDWQCALRRPLQFPLGRPLRRRPSPTVLPLSATMRARARACVRPL
jgi:hypothetical protein